MLLCLFSTQHDATEKKENVQLIPAASKFILQFFIQVIPARVRSLMYSVVTVT